DCQYLSLPQRRGRGQMNIRHIMAAGLIPLLLAGCLDQHQQDLQSFVQDIRRRPAPKIEPIPPTRSYTPYAYVANDRRSPFTAVIEVPEAVDSSGNAIRPDTDRPREPLEKFQLDSLKMVG